MYFFQAQKLKTVSFSDLNHFHVLLFQCSRLITEKIMDYTDWKVKPRKIVLIYLLAVSHLLPGLSGLLSLFVSWLVSSGILMMFLMMILMMILITQLGLLLVLVVLVVSGIVFTPRGHDVCLHLPGDSGSAHLTLLTAAMPPPDWHCSTAALQQSSLDGTSSSFANSHVGGLESR